jgi:antitoxin ParD1/3/4
MNMTSLNVSLPKTLKDYVEAQVSEGGYSTPSEYVRALIREDHKRRAQEKLEGLLVEGLGSGAPIRADREYWAQKRRRLAAHKDNKAAK